MGGGWKWLRMASACGECAQLAIDTSHHSRATGPLQEGRPTTTELPCRGREEGSRPRARSYPVKVVGHAWLYWQPKLGVVGTSRPSSFCPLSPRPRRNLHHISSKAGWLRRWCATLACSAARLFGVSLLDWRLVAGTG